MVEFESDIQQYILVICEKYSLLKLFQEKIYSKNLLIYPDFLFSNGGG